MVGWVGNELQGLASSTRARVSAAGPKYPQIFGGTTQQGRRAYLTSCVRGTRVRVRVRVRGACVFNKL